MAKTDKIVDFFCCSIYIAILLWCIVFAIISCVAETRVYVEMIRSGKVPVEASYD